SADSFRVRLFQVVELSEHEADQHRTTVSADGTRGLNRSVNARSLFQLLDRSRAVSWFSDWTTKYLPMLFDADFKASPSQISPSGRWALLALVRWILRLLPT